MIDQFCIFICNVWWLLIAGSYNYMKRTGVGRIHHGLLLLVAVGMASMIFINLWGIGWSKGILLHCFIWLWVHKVQLYWMFEQNNNALLSFFVFCFKTSIILFLFGLNIVTCGPANDDRELAESKKVTYSVAFLWFSVLPFTRYTIIERKCFYLQLYVYLYAYLKNNVVLEIYDTMASAYI